ncbi:unnamed protein product [Porites lobata]|uniref:Uncharacterized protein n=1 Tax=Porites lobata TaxID=104759 RepID=A0ABN8SE26_9CNID|nr:unnamed protein product [Porites lobata]
MVDDMRNVLFPSGRGLGSDLASKNIQSGRDHGLPDYSTVRLKGLTSFSEITKDSEVASKMKDLYQDINNVDLWVGGLAEDHEDGSDLGPTFRTLVQNNSFYVFPLWFLIFFVDMVFTIESRGLNTC